MKKPPVLTATTKQVEYALKLKERMIHNLAQEGVVVRISPGKFDILETCRNYADYRDRLKTNQHSSASDSEAGGDYEVQRARLTKAKAEMAEMESARMKGESLPAALVERTVGGMVMDAKTKLEAFAHKLSGRLEGADTLAQRHDIISEAVTDVLNELSKYDTDRIVEEYVSEHQETDAAEAEADPESVG